MRGNFHVRTGCYALSFLLLAYLEWVLRIPFTFLISGFFFVLFVISLKKHQILFAVPYIFLFLFLYNAITTWWFFDTTYSEKTLSVFLTNTTLMTLPLLAGYVCIRYLKTHEFIVIPLWLGFEYIHFIWPLSWPWLSFGHVFGKTPHLVQWYEYTGVLGGTFWIVLLGYLSYRLAKQWFSIRFF